MVRIFWEDKYFVHTIYGKNELKDTKYIARLMFLSVMCIVHYILR